LEKPQFNAIITVMKKALTVLFTLLLLNIPSMYYGWYLNWWWVDTSQHLLGGFFVAMLMYYYLKDRLKEGEFLKNTLIVVGATVFIGVVWEFSEYIANQTLIEPLYRWFGIKGYFIGDLPDTINDLLMDILGGLVFLLSHFFWNRKKQN